MENKIILEIFNIIQKEIIDSKSIDNTIEIIPIHYGNHYDNIKELNVKSHRKFTLKTQTQFFSFLIFNDGLVRFCKANILQKEPRLVLEWSKQLSFHLDKNTFDNDFKFLLNYINSINIDKQFSNYIIQLLESSIIFPNKQIVDELIDKEMMLIKKSIQALNELKKFYENKKTYLDITQNLANTDIYEKIKNENGEIEKEDNITFLQLTIEQLMKNSIVY